MIYKINKHSLLEEFGNLDYSPRSLDSNGFIMTAMKNKINGNIKKYRNEPIRPKHDEPVKISGHRDNQLDQHVINRSNSLDQHRAHNSDHISSLGH
jgi:hypothetical protein